MQRISIFDMDRTVTKKGTYAMWLTHWMRSQAPARGLLLPVSGLLGLGFMVRALDRGKLKELNQRLFMGSKVDPEVVAQEAQRFADEIVPEHCYEQAIDRLRQERAEGRRVMLATASYEFYVRPIAVKLRAEDVIATEVEHTPDGRIRPKIRGENCYGEAKLRKVERYFEERGIVREEVHVRFFTDHHSDAPVLDWADEAFAINGKTPMARLTHERGWEPLIWS